MHIYTLQSVAVCVFVRSLSPLQTFRNPKSRRERRRETERQRDRERPREGRMGGRSKRESKRNRRDGWEEI
jgi:hypothetical protein